MRVAQGFLQDKLDPTDVERDDNRFALSLIPYEETTTYKKGTRFGPEAIVDASGHIELLDETLRIDASRHGIQTLRPDITDLASITSCVSELARSKSGVLLGFLGGEHSITPPPRLRELPRVSGDAVAKPAALSRRWPGARRWRRSTPRAPRMGQGEVGGSTLALNRASHTRWFLRAS